MPGLELRDADGGTVLKVRAAPGASRDRIVGRLGDALKIAVRVAPEKGKANHAILAVLARQLRVPARALEILGGQTSRDKRVLVRGMTTVDVRDKLAEWID